MTPAEFAAYRHLMGHTLDSLARRLDVNPRTTRAWETGRDPISATAEAAILAEVAEHDRLVDMIDRADVLVRVPRSPSGEWPRGWYVAAVARAIERGGGR